eukprot:66928-Amphidinium_carterae.1
MATPTSEEEETFPTTAPGPMEVDSTTENPTVDKNNFLAYNTIPVMRAAYPIPQSTGTLWTIWRSSCGTG